MLSPCILYCLFQENQNLRHRSREPENFELLGETRSPSPQYFHTVLGIPTYIAFVPLLLGILLFLSTVWLDQRLPSPLFIKDEPANPGRFIAERAKNYLSHLTSIGPRTTGSYENEVLAVDFLTREIQFIIQRAKKVHRLSFDIQKPTGSYYLGFKPFGMTSYYTKVQNVIVRLSSEKNSTSSLLVNCHFDSVPRSPGKCTREGKCFIL